MELNLYGVAVGVGIVVAMSLIEKIAEGRLPVWEGFWYMLVPAVVGARVYHVIDEWSYYQDDWGRVVAVWQGGLGIWGAIGGAIVGLSIFAYLRARKLETKLTEEFFILGDVFALAAPLAQALGRWGNYFNRELGGKGEVPLYLLESGLNLALFMVLLLVYRRKIRGSTLGGYLLGYGLIRIVLEPLRVESFEWRGWGVAQWFGLTAVVLGLMILKRKVRRVWQ